jgi:hypothetical protein
MKVCVSNSPAFSAYAAFPCRKVKRIVANGGIILAETNQRNVKRGFHQNDRQCPEKVIKPDWRVNDIPQSTFTLNVLGLFKIEQLNQSLGSRQRLQLIENRS